MTLFLAVSPTGLAGLKIPDADQYGTGWTPIYNKLRNDEYSLPLSARPIDTDEISQKVHYLYPFSFFA